jgi:LPXTG-site transpeptidase (sortase) family protein
MQTSPNKIDRNRLGQRSIEKVVPFHQIWPKIAASLVILALLISSIPAERVQASAIVNEGSTPPGISSSQITVQPETSSDYLAPTNSYTDGTTHYYLVTQDSGKASLTAIDYKGASYPLTQVFVGSNLTAMTIGSKPLFTQSGPLSNATVFFDDGIYTDNVQDNYTGISQPNMSLIGLNKDASGEPTAILRRVPRSSAVAAINNTMERYDILDKNIYLENLIFDGQNYDMYPSGDKTVGISKSRGEYMFFFTNGSDGFVMRDCILENVGASNEDPGTNPAYYNKNLAMNFYSSTGQHNFENIIIRNVKTTAPNGVGLGIISSNQSKDNYFKNLTIVDDDSFNSASRSIKIENADTIYLAEKLNSAVFSGTLSLPADANHNHIYIQNWNYDKVVVPTNFRYAQYSSTNGVFGLFSSVAAIQVYQDVQPAVTADKSILDLQDFAWLVQDGAAVSLSDQLATLAATITHAGAHAPDANIKLSADSSGKINSFVSPDFGAARTVSLVAVPSSTSLYSSTVLVPFAAKATIGLPAATSSNNTLYNFDFDSLAKYTLQEAVVGITPLSSTTDPNEGTAGYDSYSSYAPTAAISARFTNTAVSNFSNSVFTSLVNQIQVTSPLSTLSVGSTFTLTGSLAGTSSNSFTGSAFTGTIKDTADDQTINWYSSDPSVASVDRTTGLLTALKNGTTTIIAKAADANNNGEVEKPYASFTLTVSGGSSSTGGSASENANALGIAVTGLAVPATGFAPGVITQLPAAKQAVQYQKMDQMWLEIPALNVQTSVEGIPQTDTGWDVNWLGKETGWLNGTAFPTHNGNSVLAAHVYDQNGLPGPFSSLDKLAYGDKLIIHAWGQAYTYEVREIKSISPDNSAYVFKHQETPWLTLVTCQGYDQATHEYKYRRVVRAVLVKIQ